MAKPKFEIGDKVKDKPFKEKHKIIWRGKDLNGVWNYKVKNISGPGAYGEEEYWEEDQLRDAK